MQYDPVSRLSRHIDLIRSRASAPSELVDTLRLTRLAIEKGDAKPRFPMLAMYCDWAVHSELDRNPTAWQLLKRLDATMHTVASNTDINVVINEIGKGLSLAMLRSEFVALFTEKQINTDLFTVPANWVKFQECMLNDLEGRPIGFPDDITTSTKARGRKVYDEMVAARTTTGGGNPVRRVSVSIQREPTPERPVGYHWHVRIRQDSPQHYIELTGPLRLDDSAFVTI